jgi:hypothetical protein
VAQHRRCVADLATSEPYLYEVLVGKSDTIDARASVPHTKQDKSSEPPPKRHSFYRFVSGKNNRRVSHDSRLCSRNKFCKNY